MRNLSLAACLVICAMPALAQSSAQSSAQNRSWTGSALVYTPSGAAGCDVAVMEAMTYGGHVQVTLRNGGTATLSFTLSGELAGGGQRSIATTTARLAPGRNIRVQMMRPYNASLAGSVLTLRGSACSVVS